MKYVGADWLIRKPTTPTQWDDEFEATVLDPKWNIITGGDSTFTVTKPLDPYLTSSEAVYRYNINSLRKSWLMFQPWANLNSSRGIEQDLIGLPANCFIWYRGGVNTRVASATDGDGEIFLRVFNNGTEGSNYMQIGFDTFASITEGFLRENFGGVGTNLGLIRNYFGEAMPLEYFGLQKIGATYHGWTCTASGNWIWLGSRTFAADNFNRCRLWVSDAVVSSPGRMLVGLDFFRVFSGKGPL